MRCSTSLGEIAAEACIGHVNLKVAELLRPLAFYKDVLALSTKQMNTAAFLAVGEYLGRRNRNVP
jgi:catechol-2,3-dioxygenase